MECVQVDRHLIVASDILALRQPGPNLLRFLPAHHDHVEVLLIVGEVGGGLPRGSDAVAGLALTKIRDPAPMLPGLAAQELLQPRRSGDPRDP
jgi:hypothetical protein